MTRSLTAARSLLAGCALSATGAVAADPVPDATSMIEALRNGEATALARTEAALSAMALWRETNGVGRLNAEAARAAAREIDRNDRAGALAGLPIVVKDNIQVQGLPASAATPGLAGVVSELSAPIVRLLTGEGAVVVATANMHELAFGISGYNPTYQTGAQPGVRNPYDLTRSAGGSSSGVGALVAAGVVRAGIGTDTGGSVRIPAALNGVTGLRPSIGRYPVSGVVPISHTRDTPGFLAASLRDIELLDRIATGAAPVSAAELKDVVFGVAPQFAGDLDAETAAIWNVTRMRLEEAGARFVEVDASDIVALSAQISFPIALYEARGDLESYLAGHAPELRIEDVVAAIRSPDVKATYEMFVLPGKLPAPDGDMVDAEPIYRAAIDEGRPALIAAYAALFEKTGIDALMFPTTPSVAMEASPESSSLETFSRMIRNTDPGSCAGLPGLSIPAGLGPQTGLPVGVEIDGPSGADRRLISIGLAIEAALGAIAAPPSLATE